MSGWNESVWFAMFMGVALKSTAALGAAWVAAFVLRKRSAAARHLVWTAAFAALLALPFLSVWLPVLPVPGAGALLDSGLVFQTTATARADAIGAARNPQGSSAAEPARSAPWRLDWQLSLMLLWAAGGAVGLTQMLVNCARISRLRRAARPSPDRHLSVELAQALGIRDAVDVLEMGGAAMPMTFGFLRPAVFLPSDAAEWSEERRRIVLLHELAHVRRGDVAAQMMARLALILNWWNPLAWTAWREFLKERERATDDLVLNAGARASDYAGHLLEVARTMPPAPNLGWAAVAMARPSQLEGRLLAILDSRVNRNTAGRASALAAALAAIAIVAPLAAVRAQDSAAPAVPPDVDATMRAAVAQKNHDMLDKAAAGFEALQQYDTAHKLLEQSAAIREEVSGNQSLDYGAGLIKIADLERRRGRQEEAEAFYTKASLVLGDRPEAAPALMYLGMTALRKKDFGKAVEYFETAQKVDVSQPAIALLWIAVTREREENSAEAEAMYKSALAAAKPDSADAATLMALYGEFLRRQGREDEAQAILDRAKSVRKALRAAAAAQMHTDSNVQRVGGGVTAPRVVAKIEPQYSEEARLAKYSGTVVLYLEIGPDGLAHNLRVVEGLGLGLDEKAVEAVRSWRFTPGTKNGEPVTVAAHIEVNFRLK
jgi:TonB family protein